MQKIEHVAKPEYSDMRRDFNYEGRVRHAIESCLKDLQDVIRFYKFDGEELQLYNEDVEYYERLLEQCDALRTRSSQN